MNKFSKYWLPVIIWGGVIFTLSSIPDLKSGLKEDFILRKIAHILEFAILTLLLYRAIVVDEPRINKAIIFSLIIALFYALSDEYHQIFVEGRQGSFRDAGIDSIGILIVALVCYIKNRKKSPTN
ncbi:MAG: VanZ family protein [Patescibacteria group bacterium]